MADHKVEQIMAKIEELMTGLDTTGLKVYRARALPLDRDDDLPAWLIFQGADLVLDRHSPDHMMTELEVFLDALAAPVDGVETELNQMHKEATVALEADYTLGLSFVQQIDFQGREAPELDAEGDRPLMMQRSLWIVTYDRLRTDPSS